MAKPPVTACKNCTHLPIKPGERITRKAYRCGAPIPEMPPLPICVTRHLGFRWPPGQDSVWPDDGANCPTFAPRKP